MDFFLRKRPCLLIEAQETQENTKKLFLNKINFLQKQYKFCFETLQRNSDIAPEFIKGALLSFDLGSKVLDCLSHLINSTELEWEFLNFFSNRREDAYILGKFKENYSILNTESFYNDAITFFFDLLGLGIINIPTWKNLCRLQRFSYSFGLSYLNDYSYYSSKNIETIEQSDSFPPIQADLERIESIFNKFLGKPIVLKNCTPISWRLMVMVREMKNETEIVRFLKKNEYKYDLVRRNKKDLNLPNDGFTVLSECLSNINNFSDIHFIAREIELFGGDAPFELLKHLICFFFSKGDFVFATQNLERKRQTKEEKLFNALEMIRFIQYLCDVSISITKDFDKRMEKNFRDQCERYMEAFKDEEIINKCFFVDFFIFKMILGGVNKLKQNEFYIKHYSEYIDHCLNITPRRYY